MTCRAFDPSTASLNHAISVRRTDHATILLNVPRNINDFTAPKKKPSLLGRVAEMFSFAR